MAECIKTGAYVQFPEYGAFAPADIFAVDNTAVIRFTEAGWTYEVPRRPVTHIVVIGNEGWHRQDLGVTVIPFAQLFAKPE